jgi:hypothetical protein
MVSYATTVLNLNFSPGDSISNKITTLYQQLSWGETKTKHLITLVINYFFRIFWF